MKSSRVVATLNEIATDQWGLVTTAQARRQDITDTELKRANDASLLDRVRRGVWRLPGAPTDHLEGLRAAWLSTNPSLFAYQRYDEPTPVVITGATAAWLHGIGDLIPEPYQFTCSQRLQSRQPDIQFHRRNIAAEDIQIVHGLPTGSIERTITDLAANRYDLSLVADTTADAATATSINLNRLEALLDAEAPRNKESIMNLTGLNGGVSANRLIEATTASRLAANIGYTNAVEKIGKALSSQLHQIAPTGTPRTQVDKIVADALTPYREAAAKAMAPMANQLQAQATAPLKTQIETILSQSTPASTSPANIGREEGNQHQ